MSENLDALEFAGSVVEAVQETSVLVEDGRDIEDVLSALMEEVGELATEVRIAQGKSYKAPKEGLVDG